MKYTKKMNKTVQLQFWATRPRVPDNATHVHLHNTQRENKAQLSQSPHQWHPLPRALLLTPHVLYCICNVHIRIHTSSSTLTPQSRSDRECDGLSGLSGPLTTDYFYYWLPPAFAPLCLPSDSHLTQYLYSVCLQAEDSSSCFALLQKSLCLKICFPWVSSFSDLFVCPMCVYHQI